MDKQVEAATAFGSRIFYILGAPLPPPETTARVSRYKSLRIIDRVNKAKIFLPRLYH